MNSHPSPFKLKLAYWYVSRRTLIKKILTYFLLLIFSSFVFYGAYGLIASFFNQKDYDVITSGMLAQKIDFEIYQIKLTPAPLKLGQVTVLETGPETSDFLVQIENPNPRWFIKKITYRFTGPGYASQEFTDFILPQQNKYLIAFNQVFSSQPPSLDLEIVSREYQRLRRAPDVTLSELLVEGALHLPPTDSPISSSRVRFKVKNNSIYNFYEVPFKIILFNGPYPQGLNLAHLARLKSGETRTKEIVWPQKIDFPVTQVIVVPDVNLFAEENYLPDEPLPPEPS